MNYAEAISKIAKKAEELKIAIDDLYANKFTDEAGPQYHISNVIVAEAAAQRAAQREARLDAYHRMDVYGEYSVMGFTPENVMMRLPEVFEAGWRAEEGADELREAFGITPEQAQEMFIELAKMEERQRLAQIADQVYEASVLLRGFTDEEPEEDLPEGYVFPLNIE